MFVFGDEKQEEEEKNDPAPSVNKDKDSIIDEELLRRFEKSCDNQNEILVSES